MSKGDTVAAELLQYDTLVSYRGKVRSEAVGLPKQTKELLQEGEAFWRNEEIASQYIPNYTFKEWRKIRQQYVEMPMSEDTAKVLGIKNVPNVPFTVVIDVNKEVKPFIRPEIELVSNIKIVYLIFYNQKIREFMIVEILHNKR